VYQAGFRTLDHPGRALSAGPKGCEVVDPAAVEVFLVAGTRFYREGLADALARRPRLRVVGTAAAVTDALTRIGLLSPDVVLLDTAVPGGLELVGELRAGPSPVPVIALALPERASDVLACAEAGVAGYVTQDASLDELAATVLGVLRGELRCSPRIAASLFIRVAALAAQGPAPVPGVLTRREQEVLTMLDEGLSNRQIAARLCVELATVKNHVHHILAKLQVASRAEAVALTRGLAPSGPGRARRQLPAGGLRSHT
jgi:DNA-binding NarL/FixJ family response regulator